MQEPGRAEASGLRHEDAPIPHQRRALLAIAGSQLLVLTLWFSASAAAPQLEVDWGLSSGETAGLTLAVQIGFVLGALGSAALAFADPVPARQLFTLAALTGAAANAGLLTLGEGDFALAFLLRLVTGIALAGVYPSGLKIMTGWFRRGRGMALGVLVGALTVGTAGPHLIRGLGFGWRGVIGVASILAILGAIVLWSMVRDGPYETPRQAFSWRHVGEVVSNRGVRLSTYGYLGHMWELYGMWTWTAAFLAASAAAAGLSDGWVPTATFAVIAVGGAGAWLAGVAADRMGRTIVAGGSMAVSGSCALVTPLVFGLSPWLGVPLFVVWGLRRHRGLGAVLGDGHRNRRRRVPGHGADAANRPGFPSDPGNHPGCTAARRCVGLAMGLPMAGSRAGAWHHRDDQAAEVSGSAPARRRCRIVSPARAALRARS